jgi:hypothetical protein
LNAPRGDTFCLSFQSADLLFRGWPARVALLDGMDEFVGKTPDTTRPVRSVHIRAEKDVALDRECIGIKRFRGLSRKGIGVDANIAEIVSEVILHLKLHSRH